MSPVRPAGLRRYSRHLLIPEVGLAGQERLAARARARRRRRRARLARACRSRRRGRRAHRHRRRRRGRPDQPAAPDAVRDAGRGAPEGRDVPPNGCARSIPHVAVDAYPLRLDAGERARPRAPRTTPWSTATDTFGSRYLINDACVLEGMPDVFASIFRFDGQVTVFVRRAGRAIAASFPYRRPRAACRRAPRVACSACCPASSARGRRRRRSSSCSGSASRSPGG